MADRKVPAAILAATVAGTYVGPGFSMGWIGKGAESGYLYAFVGLAYVLQTVLVGLVVAPRMRRAPSRRHSIRNHVHNPAGYRGHNCCWYYSNLHDVWRSKS